MVYFDHILHTYTCQHSLTNGMRNHLFDGQGIAEQNISCFPMHMLRLNMAATSLKMLCKHLYLVKCYDTYWIKNSK